MTHRGMETICNKIYALVRSSPWFHPGWVMAMSSAPFRLAARTSGTRSTRRFGEWLPPPARGRPGSPARPPRAPSSSCWTPWRPRRVLRRPRGLAARPRRARRGPPAASAQCRLALRFLRPPPPRRATPTWRRWVVRIARRASGLSSGSKLADAGCRQGRASARARRARTPALASARIRTSLPV